MKRECLTFLFFGFKLTTTLLSPLTARSGRRVTEMKQKGGTKVIPRGSVGAASSTHQPPSRSSRRGRASQNSNTLDGKDEDEEDEDSYKAASTGRRSASKNMATAQRGRGQETVAINTPKKKPELKRQERKASVRKKTYDIDDSDSELTDAPEVDSDEADQEADTESDGEMAKKLEEAGDGESLLGSAISEGEEGETDVEEEKFIIQNIARRQAKALHKRKSGRSSASAAGNEDSQVEDGFDQEYRDGTLSPQTMQQLGIDGFDDDLFAPQDPFHSSSEPSFTDFFGSGSEDEGEEAVEFALEPRHDDNELTTDDEDSDVTDISDLDESMLGAAPFLGREALAAGACTQMTTTGTELGAEIPLLVIEDLDGRLIYARAGDGEAVFGSDGEFEFVDESDEDDTDEDMDGLGFDYRSEAPWNGWKGSKRDEIDSDEGDTTDELPDEDMPFPRLLIGSVALHGGRNARRARAIAAKSRRLSPNVAAARSRAESVKGEASNNTSKSVEVASTAGLSAPTTPEERVEELDFSISTEALARDPQGTLEAAAKSLGLTTEEVARLVAGIQGENSSPMKKIDEIQEDQANQIATPISKPQMGSFMPSSFKSIRRAVIDGNRQAPSPFSCRYGMQKRGLANHKRRSSIATPSSKRIRRFSSVDVASQQEATGEDTSEVPTSSREASPVDPMDLDDVLDATMLWRGSHSSSPPAEGEDESTPVMRATKRPSNASTTASPSSTGAGLNLNAFARWHRIPMGAFRDGQGAASSSMAQQPLGSFLLTRSSRAQQSQLNRKNKLMNQTHSPFRGRGQGDGIHLGTAPQQRHDPSSANGRSDAFVVSPVLWPVRNGAKEEGHNNAAIWYTPKVVNSVQNNTIPGKTMMTKREKRQKRARKAALKAALQTANGETQSVASWNGSPAPSTLSTNVNDSPVTAMPRLSITDTSPRASPNLRGKTPLPPSSLQQSYTNQNESRIPSSIAMDIPKSNFTTTIATNPTSHNILSTSGSSQSSGGSLQQPPSSVFGVPLHSPLFGGILDPTNLGFCDDLEERDEEGILLI